MAFKQIAFDFDEAPKQPVAAPKPIVVKPEVIDLPLEKISPKKPVVIKSTKGRKSLKEASSGADLINVPEDEILFQKQYYTIGIVATMFNVNQSLIRFWENEFDILKPKKNGKGDRMFRPEDIKNLQLIHHLIREKKYTLEGSKEHLKNSKKINEKFATIESLKKLKSFLFELKTNL